jgi:signal transduction histidine kinase
MQAEALKAKGAALIDLGKYHEALAALKTASSLYESFLDAHSTAYVYSLIGRAYTQIGDYKSAQEMFSKSKNVFDKIPFQEIKANPKISKELAALYNYLGLLHKRLGDYRLGLQYHYKELYIYQSIKDTVLIGSAYADIGRAYRYLEKNDSALYFTEKGYELIKKYGLTSYLANTEKKLALIYSELDDYNNALKYFNLALEKYIGYGDLQGQIVAIDNIGRINYRKGNFKEALEKYNLALSIALSNDDADNLLLIYRFISEAYVALKDYKNAYEYHYKFAQLRDSIYQIDKEKAVQEMESKYKVKEKNQSIIELKQKNQEIYIYLTASIAICSIIVIVLLYNRYKLNRRLNLELKDKNENLNHAFNDTLIQKKLSDEQLRDKNDLLINLGSELKTPFNLIYGYINLLKIELRKYSNENADKYLENIQKKINVLSGLFDDFKELDQIENGKYIPNLKQFKIKELAQGLIENYKKYYEADDSGLVVNMDENVSIKTDFEILNKILIHILSYIISVHGESIFVQIERAENSEVIIAFKYEFDENPKIDKKNQNNQENNNKNLPLDLTIAKKFVTLLDGKLDFNSELEIGTKISLYLYSETV